MGRIALPLGLAALLYLNPLFAQTEPEAGLTLGRALSLAAEANPDLAAARRELDAAAAAREQASMLRNPELSIDVEDTREATRQTTFWLGQPIELGGKRNARLASADRERDIAGAELDMRLAEVRTAVSQAFCDVLVAQERLRLAQDSMELARRGLDIAGRRVAAGKISPVEETRARVAAAGARIDLGQAEAGLANARKRLSALWGNPDPHFAEADGDLETLPTLPSLDSLNAHLPEAPEAVRARLEVGRREALTRLEESRRYPDLILRGGVQRNEAAHQSVNVVGLAIAIPIFDRNQGGIGEARLRAEKARDLRAAAEVRLRSSVGQLHQRLAAALQEASTLRSDILPDAQSALDAAMRGFEYGKFGFLDVLDAQRTLFLARGQYIRALGEVRRTAAEAEALLGPQGALLFAPPHAR